MYWWNRGLQTYAMELQIFIRDMEGDRKHINEVHLTASVKFLMLHAYNSWTNSINNIPKTKKLLVMFYFKKPRPII